MEHILIIIYAQNFLYSRKIIIVWQIFVEGKAEIRFCSSLHHVQNINFYKKLNKGEWKMESILEILRTDAFLIIMLIGMLILLILYILNSIKLSKLRNSYAHFMKRLGKEERIDVTLNRYMDRIDEVAKNQEKLNIYCDELQKNIDVCVQKIGIVRYSAFKDTGSDLSFTLAILDKYNDGIVLNGIYSREMSNIYAKPIKNGTSEYTLSEEEKQAIKKAINGERG